MDISTFTKSQLYLKGLNSNYKTQQAQIFEVDEIKKFLSNAPDAQFIEEKLVLLFALYECLRCNEIKNLCFKDIELNDDKLKITIRKSKSDRKGSGFCFLASAHPTQAYSPVYYYLQYTSSISDELKKSETQFFLRYSYTTQRKQFILYPKSV